MAVSKPLVENPRLGGAARRPAARWRGSLRCCRSRAGARPPRSRSASMRMSKRCAGRRTRQPSGSDSTRSEIAPSTTATSPSGTLLPSSRPRRLAAQTDPLLGGGRRRSDRRPRHLGGTGLAAGDLLEQCGGSLDRERRQGGIDAALEALSGVGEQAQSPGSPRDGGRREMGGLEQHFGGAVADRSRFRP